MSILVYFSSVLKIVRLFLDYFFKNIFGGILLVLLVLKF